MDKEVLRKEAVAQFILGQHAKQICSELYRSRRWLFKWLKRYRSGDPRWFADQPKTPRRIACKTNIDTEQHVIEVRKRLQAQKYSQVGPLAIAYELEHSGLQPPPLRTITRILQRHGLTRKRQRYVRKGKDYPQIEADSPHKIHQLDIVGPRFLAKDGRFYAINVMDVFTGKAAVNPRRQRTDMEVVSALLDTWQRLAIPIYLQMDNQLPLRGSNRYPRSFGIVVRVCLYLGIQPVFIPISEPWRNGCVEKFQDLFDKLFFRSQHFQSFEHLLQEVPIFEEFHNRKHRYSTRQGKTPNEREMFMEIPIRRLAEHFELPKKLYIRPGKIHLVRFIRSDSMLDVFGLKFVMPKEVIYEYVTTTIDTGKETLRVVHDGKTVHHQHFNVGKTPMEVCW